MRNKKRILDMQNEKIGKKFGMLTVQSYAGKDDSGRTLWNCKCDCGKEIVIKNGNLKKIKSCGCAVKGNFLGMGIRRSDMVEYQTWCNMKARCYNPNNRHYKNYGGRGIKICDRWVNSFENFYKDMGKRPEGKYSIDRIDVDGDYEPNNCRWATDEEQMNNMTTNHNITYKGETHTLKQWSEILDINYKTLCDRLNKYEMSVEKAFTYKKSPKKEKIKKEIEYHTYEDFKDKIRDMSTASPRLTNIKGKRFGALVVKELLEPIMHGSQKRVAWLCQCDCGNWVSKLGNELRSGHTTSCGCGKHKVEVIQNLWHGLSKTKEYETWARIKQVCYNPKQKNYCNYGAKGIEMDSRWKDSFENFYADMGKKPTDDCVLIRIDKKGDFTKENCCWKRK